MTVLRQRHDENGQHQGVAQGVNGRHWVVTTIRYRTESLEHTPAARPLPPSGLRDLKRMYAEDLALMCRHYPHSDTAGVHVLGHGHELGHPLRTAEGAVQQHGKGFCPDVLDDTVGGSVAPASPCGWRSTKLVCP